MADSAPVFTDEGPKYYQAAYEHNSPFALPGPYQTPLSPADEKAFRAWVASHDVPFDPEADVVDYDMRGFWLAKIKTGKQKWKEGSHFPDTWKTPYDTSFSAESKYATPDNPFHWSGNNLVDARTGQVVFGAPQKKKTKGEDMAKPEQTLDQFAKSVGYPADDIKLYYPWLFDVNGRFLGPGHDRDSEMVDPQSGDIVPVPSGTIITPLPPPSGTSPLAHQSQTKLAVGGQTDVGLSTVAGDVEAAIARPGEVLQSAADQLAAKLRAAGASDEAIQHFTSDPNTVQALLDDVSGAAILGIATNFPAQTSVQPYVQAAQQLGFTNDQGAVSQAPPAALPGPFLVGPPGQEVPKPIAPELTRDYEVNSDSGGIRYSSGVIADPTSGQVFFPVNSDAPGSPGWMNEIRSTWSPKQITDWRKRLTAMGYLPAGGEKVRGFDQSLLDALSKYHQLRYLNFGKPTPLDLTAAQTATQQAKPVVPDAVFIRQNVRQEYQRVFGKDPSDAQLEQWTGFVQQLATHLQTAKDYSPDRAASVAGERAIEAIDTSPDAQFLRQNQQENTDLHDAIVGAVQTTRSLMG